MRAMAHRVALPNEHRTPALALALASALALAVLPSPAAAQSPSDASLSSLRERLSRDGLSPDELALAAADARALASGSADPRVQAEALFFAADALDRSRRFALALAAYRESLSRAPGGRYAARARARALSLEPNARDEFVGLTALESARRAPTPAALRALAAQSARWQPTPARAEARLFAAAGLLRHGAVDESLALLRAVADDPESSQDDRALALHELARARIDRGDPESAHRELAARSAPAEELALTRRLSRRKSLTRAAWVALVAQLTAATAALAMIVLRGKSQAILRAWSRPMPLVHLAVLTVGGALLTRSYDNHDASHVLAFGAGALAVYLAATATSVAAHTADAPDTTAASLARASLAVASVLAVSFLSMLRFDPGMLDGISL